MSILAAIALALALINLTLTMTGIFWLIAQGRRERHS